jgi:hypothetical protein
MNFKQQLEVGQLGESRIASWLKKRGNHILPVYEVSKDQMMEMKKTAGPGLFLADGSRCVAPDMLVFNPSGLKFIECKSKDTWAFHRNTQTLVTGIDLHHYKDYFNVQQRTQTPVWLLFLQSGGVTPGYSGPTPAGLYGGSLDFLIKNEHHRHSNWGKYGMVYWEIDTFTLLAGINDVLN